MTRKTTVYLTDELKTALERLAQQRGSSEADVIRAAITAEVSQIRPRVGFLDEEPIAHRADEMLDGFGHR